MIEGNLPLEIFWTAVPAIVVLFVGLYSYDIYDRMGGMVPLGHEGMNHQTMAEPSDERIWGGLSTVAGEDAAPLPVEVTAMQFAFLFHYPKATSWPQLHVQPIVPCTDGGQGCDPCVLGSRVPDQAGRDSRQPTQLSFTATRPGSYPIVCAELCGPYPGACAPPLLSKNPKPGMPGSKATPKPTNPPRLEAMTVATRIIQSAAPRLQPSGWLRYFSFSVDHKVIGLQYLVCGFAFYLVGGALAGAIRTELASPVSDFMARDVYNQVLTLHGTVMIFLWIVPL